MFQLELPSGRKAICSTIEDLLALDEAISKRAGNAGALVPVSSDGDTAGASNGDDLWGEVSGYSPPARNLELTIRLLGSLIPAGPNGVAAAQLAEAIGVDGTRGLGGALSCVNRTLRDIRCPDDVAYTTRSRGTETKWYAGPAAQEIYEHLFAIARKPG